MHRRQPKQKPPVNEAANLVARLAKLFIEAQKFSLILIKDKQYDQAIHCYDMYLEADPESVAALSAKKELLIHFGRIKYQDGQFAESHRFLTQASDISVDHEYFNRDIAKGFLALANAHALNDNHKLAIDCFIACRKADPKENAILAESLIGESRSHIRERDYTHSSQLLSRAITLLDNKECPRFQAALLEYQALRARRHSDFDRAILKYKELLQIESENLLALKGIGCLSREKDPALSLLCLEKALAIAPDDVTIWQIKAMHHKSNNEPTLEHASYQKILDLQPDNFPAKQSIIGLFSRNNKQAAKREAGNTVENTRASKKR